MFLNNRIQKIIFFSVYLTLLAGLFLFYGPLAQAATFAVDSTGDEADANAGNGACATAIATCTLRAAVQEANALAGADTINFSGLAFPSGQETITVSSQLPQITTQITIDASGQWDATNDQPGIKLTKTGSVNYGLSFSNTSDNSRVSGLTITGFDSYAVLLYAEDMQIGLDCFGTPNNHQKNVIINNAGGMQFNTADSNNIAGNWIGLSADGETLSANTAIGFYLVNSDTNIIGFDDDPAFSCTAEQARNIFAKDSNYGASNIMMMIRQAEQNKISGNYFNILPDGSDIIVYSNGMGIYLYDQANYNFIGTDGDGVDDDQEGNVGAGMKTGVIYGYDQVENPGYAGNRISGNIFGGDPTGTVDLYTGDSPEIGVSLIWQPSDHIIGYCDDDDDSAIGVDYMCSDAGADHPEYQANYFIGNNGSATNIYIYDLIGAGLVLTNYVGGGNNYVYGNYFGVGKDGSSMPSRIGVQLGISNEYNYIGNTGVRTNIIKNNEIGVYILQKHSRDGNKRNKIQYNTITNNTSHGIYFWNSKNSNYGSANNIEIENNTISNNGGSGIYLYGSSALVNSNTINNNSQYGIYCESILSDFVGLAPDYTPENPYNAKQTPLGYAADLTCEPSIGGSGDENTIDNNSLGGIYLLDSKPENLSTLNTDNNIGDNNDNFDIKVSWWGAVEILDKSYNPLTTGSHTVTIIPQSGSNYSGSAVDTGEFAGDTSDGAWGPTSFDYDEEATWFNIADYTYDKDGNKINYGPFTIKVSGDHANDSLNPSFTFNGLDDDINLGGVPTSYITGSGLYRYQIAEAVVSTVPAQPTNVSPVDGATEQSRTLTLSASSFLDASETHTASVWKIYSDVGCTSPVYNSGDSSDLISHTVTSGYLSKNTTYYWSVSYKNSYGNYSAYASCTSFTTYQANISFSTIPKQTWNEDNTKQIDLDDYFTNVAGFTLTYSVFFSPKDINVDINDNGRVTFTPDTNWYGTNTIVFRATDFEGETKNSNTITLKVNAVNDAPSKISSGFSPRNKATTSSLTPTLSWDASSDPDNKKSDLTYQVRIGTSDDPINNSLNSYTSAKGEASVKITTSLTDEATYYWSVRAYDTNESKGEWSAVKNFYVNTENKPEINIEKVVTIGSKPFSFLGSIIKKVEAETDSHIEFRKITNLVYQTPLLIFVIFSLILFSFFTFRFIKKPKHLLHYLFSHPSLSFSKIAPKALTGTYKLSYSFYKKNNILSRLFLSFSTVAIIIMVFIHLSPVSQAANDNGVAVEPNTYLQYTLSVENSGDGDATNAVLTDVIPAGTTLDESSLKSSNSATEALQQDNNIVFNISTLAQGETETLSYVVQVNNPCSESAITASAPGFVSNEISQAQSSNATQNSIISSTLNLYLQNTRNVAISYASAAVYQNNQKLATAVSNYHGFLSFSGLASGTYYVYISGPNNYTFTYTNYYTLSKGQTMSDIISVAPEILEQQQEITEEAEEYITITIGDKEYKIPKNIKEPKTEEEKLQMKDQMELFLKLLTLNGQSVENMAYFEATYSSIPGIEEYKDANGNIKTIIKISGPDLILKGITLPKANITITVRSEPIVKVTQADDYGKWEMRIPLELLPPGEHIIYAQSELYGVETDQIILGKFTVPESKQKLSKTMWLFIINLGLIIALTIAIFLYSWKKSIKVGAK